MQGEEGEEEEEGDRVTENNKIKAIRTLHRLVREKIILNDCNWSFWKVQEEEEEKEEEEDRVTEDNRIKDIRALHRLVSE